MTYLRPIIYTAVATIVLVFFQPVMSAVSEVEGKLFPVVSLATVKVETDPTESTSVLISGSAIKYRDCQFEAIDWGFGDSENSVPSAVAFLAGPKLREPGRMIFGPWKILMTKDQFENQSFALVKHKCHPGWLTTTRFY